MTVSCPFSIYKFQEILNLAQCNQHEKHKCCGGYWNNIYIYILFVRLLSGLFV